MISDSDTPHKTQVELNIYRFDVFSKNLNWSCVSSMPTHFYHVIGVVDVSLRPSIRRMSNYTAIDIDIYLLWNH